MDVQTVSIYFHASSPSPTLDCINDTNFFEAKCRKIETASKISDLHRPSMSEIMKELNSLPETKIKQPPPSPSSRKKEAARPDHIKRPMNAFMISFEPSGTQI